MAIGVIAGGVAQALWQLPAVLKTGMRFGFISPRVAFRDPGMKKVFALIGPTIIGMAAYQINDLVSTAFASRAGVGIASSLQYSIRLQELILASSRFRRAPSPPRIGGRRVKAAATGPRIRPVSAKPFRPFSSPRYPSRFSP